MQLQINYYNNENILSLRNKMSVILKCKQNLSIKNIIIIIILKNITILLKSSVLVRIIRILDDENGWCKYIYMFFVQ